MSTAHLALYDQTGLLVLSKNVNTTQDLATYLEVGQVKRGNYVLIITVPNGNFKNHIILE